MVWIPTFRMALRCHHIRDDRAPVAALSDELRVSQALHQRDPGARRAGRVPAGLVRLAGEPVTRHRRKNHIEGVRCAPAVRGGIDQRIDDLQLMDDRAGPAVRNDDRQCVRVLRADVDEMNVQSIDPGDELRQGVQPRLHLAPVVLRRPVARDVLHQRERDALRIVRDGLFLGPLRGGNAPAEVLKLGLGHVDGEGADRGIFSRLARGGRLGNGNCFSVGGHGRFLCPGCRAADDARACAPSTARH